MNVGTAGALLAADEPPAAHEENVRGRSNFLITVDHGGARIPRRLGDLGLSRADLTRHIAWDIGALGLARKVASRLDAALIAQNYSRLVIDCNRDPRIAASIPAVSETTEIPGNRNLGPEEIAARRAAIFDPYHRRIGELLDARSQAHRPAILVSQHTMTDVFKGVRREMHAAVLYNRDRRFAGLVLEALRRETGLRIADNEPYFVSDATDYTIPHHAEARRLAHVEIEVRQDLVSGEAGQQEWGLRIAAALEDAERALIASGQLP